MKRGLFVRSISWMLVFVLLLQIAPLQTLAAHLPTEPNDSDDDDSAFLSVEDMLLPDILGEVEELREEDSKQFLMDDGSYLAVSYGMPIHYQDNKGEWIDIDNTLTPASTYSSPSAYSVVNGEAATAFAGTLTEGLLFSTKYKGNQASLSLLDATEVVQLLQQVSRDDLAQKDADLVTEPAETTGSEVSVPAGTEAVSTEPDETELLEILDSTEDTVSQETNDDSVETSQKEVNTEKIHMDEPDDPVSTEGAGNVQAVQPETPNTKGSEEENLGGAESKQTALVPQAPEEASSTKETEPMATMAPSVEELVYDRTTVAQIIEPEEIPFTLTEEQAPLADQIIPEKLSSSILYSDVYPDVDLEYNITGYNIKESIIVKKPLDSYSFSFRLDLDGLTPILQEDGSVSMTDENGDAIYLIPAPYMFDADYRASNAASYTVTALEDGYLLTVEADAEWINAEDRAFPVTIDPTLLITAGNASGDIYATYVEQGSPTTLHGSQQNLYTGYTTYAGIKERIIYMNFNQLPTIPTGSTVVNASLNLWLTGYTEINCKEMQIGAYEVTDSKPSTASSYYSWIYYMTWKEKAAYNTANMIDYTGASAAKKSSYLSWDLTELVNKWYTTGTENRTVALAGTESGSYSSTYCAEPVFYAYGQTHPPILTVSYRNNVGIEPYYTYQTMSAGNAGTAYISDFSSQLTVAKDLFTFSSTVHPFTAQLIYNSAYFAKQSDNPYDLGKELGLAMHFGSGWTYNFIQSVKRETINNEPYIRYMDGDGTLHYFAKDAQKSAEINKKTGENKTYYFDEDGLGLKINEYHTNYYSLTDDKGNELIFVDGFLLWILDADSNKISLHYSKNGASVPYDYPSASGARLEYITQKPYGGPETTIATFTYKSHESVANYLDTITDYAGNQYAFDYQNGTLVGIRYNGQKIVTYTMAQGSGKLKSELTAMTDMESGYGIKFTYQNHRVTSVTETAGGSSGRKLAVSKPDDRSTIYRDAGNDGTLNTADDILTYYGLDYAGRTVNAYTTDASGTILGASNAVYSGTGSTDRTNNRTMRTASIGMAAQQEMRNSGFELTSGDLPWTTSKSNSSVSAAVTTDKPRTGFKSLKLQGTQGQSGLVGAYRLSNYLPTQTTYIFSAYVNTSQAQSFTGSGVYLQITDTAGNTWKSPCVDYQTSSLVDGGWVRLNTTFPTKGAGKHTIAVYADGVSGAVYVDDFQLERTKGPVAASLQAESTAVSNANLLENGSLQYWEHGWTLNSGASFVTKCGVNSTSADAYSIRVNGNPSANNYASQTVSLNQPGTQSYVLSGWAKANAVPDNVMSGNPKTDSEAAAKDQNKQFGLRAVLTYTDGTKEYHYTPFNPELSGWQFTSYTIVPKQTSKTVKEIQIICAYEKNANTAWV